MISSIRHATYLAAPILGVATIASTLSASAQDVPATPPDPKADYSPYPEQDFPNQVLFGDTHLHTAYSSDAGLVGTTLTPDDAYRFARGETVVSSTGVPGRLARPLDFLVVSDHSENLGLPVAISENLAELLDTEWGRQIAEVAAPGTAESAREAYDVWLTKLNASDDPLAGTEFGKTMWLRVIEAAERNNVPGAFTALIGFEWTSMPGGNNLHRNVIFRDSADRASRVVPISAYDTEDPEQLWDWMEAYEKATGGQVLAIPHNGNLSNGLMFDDVTLTDRRPLDRAYAERRMRWEPVYEVTQIKGDGETHPSLSPDDAFADFETWDLGSFGPEAKTPDMLPKEYARAAFRRGLAFEQDLGANPFRFGLIGSTDAHTAMSTSAEDNFFGKITILEPTVDPVRFEEPITGRAGGEGNIIRAWETGAAGMAAVWARENTREAIFDAFARREVYATTGTRLRVRFFAGWNYQEADLDRSNFAEYAYDNGVRMGANLTAAPDEASPTFLIRGLRDPDGANLDRIQVIKGWLGANGETHERIYDVVCADDREVQQGNAQCTESVGNTVNVEDAAYDNSIGAPFLQAWWTDPDFDLGQRAFYYVRVLEIPTPRWTTYDAKIFGVELPDEAPTSIQERAYTSPIWFTP